MRTNIYDLLRQRGFDFKEEYRRLWVLLVEEKSIHYAIYFCTLIDYIDKNYFRDLGFRDSYIEIYDMMQELGLNDTTPDNVECLYRLCEFLMAVLDNETANKHPAINDQRRLIFENIIKILDKTNHTAKKNAEGFWIIIEKKPDSTLAAEIVENDQASCDIFEYNHFALKGNLNDKRKILSNLANYVEPILDSPNFPECNTLKNLRSDIRLFLNNMSIRHNNDEGKYAKNIMGKITDDELEEWYDKTYQMILAVIIIMDYYKIRPDIEKLRKEIKN